MIQALTQASVVVGSTRVVKLVTVVSGTINIGDTTTMLIAAGGGAAFGATDDVQCCVINSNVYFCNGTVVKKLDCSTGAVSTFAPSGMPTDCRLICNWRGRLVLARQDATPHLWYMSRLGDESDWDFSAQDPGAAVAGNDSRAGTIGDVITALMPMSDDRLAIGGDHTLWMMVGDPGYGGQIVPVSEQIGVVGARAWTQAPNGAVFFVSPQGLNVLAAGVKEISDPRVADYFKDVNKKTQYISLAWDRDRGGLWLLRQEISGAVTAQTHLYWDETTNSFWPQRFGNSDMKPQCALMYDGDGPDDRFFIVGGASDKLYYFNELAMDDAGSLINSRLALGPVMPAGPVGEAKLVLVHPVLGTYPDHPSLSVALLGDFQAGPDPYQALNNPTITQTLTWSGTISNGRQAPQCMAMRGNSFWLILRNNDSLTTFVLETVNVQFQPAGRLH